MASSSPSSTAHRRRRVVQLMPPRVVARRAPQLGGDDVAAGLKLMALASVADKGVVALLRASIIDRHTYRSDADVGRSVPPRFSPSFIVISLGRRCFTEVSRIVAVSLLANRLWRRLDHCRSLPRVVGHADMRLGMAYTSLA